MRKYLKVQKDICPKCKKEREIVVKGMKNRKRGEVPMGIIGYKCWNCGDCKMIDEKGLDKLLSFGNN